MHPAYFYNCWSDIKWYRDQCWQISPYSNCFWIIFFSVFTLYWVDVRRYSQPHTRDSGIDTALEPSSLSFQPTAHLSPVSKAKDPSKLATWPPSNDPVNFPSQQTDTSAQEQSNWHWLQQLQHDERNSVPLLWVDGKVYGTWEICRTIDLFRNVGDTCTFPASRKAIGS